MSLERAKTISDIVGALILPLVLAGVGYYFTSTHDHRAYEQQQIDKARDEKRKNLDELQQLIPLMDRLEDESPRKKEGALILLKHYAADCDIAKIVVPVFFDGLNDPAAQVKDDTHKALRSVWDKCGDLREEIETGWAAKTDQPEASEQTAKEAPGGKGTVNPSKGTPTETADSSKGARVYIHIRDIDQRPAAQKIKDSLEASGFVVPGIERLDVGPPSSELRFFKDSEQTEADTIAKTLPVSGVQARRIRGYENSSGIRPRHYELWLAPGSIALAPGRETNPSGVAGASAMASP